MYPTHKQEHPTCTGPRMHRNAQHAWNTSLTSPLAAVVVRTRVVVRAATFLVQRLQFVGPTLQHRRDIKARDLA